MACEDDIERGEDEDIKDILEYGTFLMKMAESGDLNEIEDED